MRNRMGLWLVILALTITGCLCANDDAMRQWADGNNRFGADFYQQLAQAKPGENLCFSPISAYLAFAMLYPGATGRTRDEIADVLHFDLPEPQLHEVSQEVARRYAETDTTLGVIELANSLWLQQGFPIEEAFTATLKRYYQAQCESCDFANNPEGERKRINAWGSEKTHGRIPEAVPFGAIDPNTRLVLANATYLKQKWLHPFEKGSTHDADFHLAGGTVQTPTMHDEFTVCYKETADYQSIELPYQDERFSMILVLPREGEDIDRFTMKMLDGGISSCFPDENTRENTRIALPKFEFHSGAGMTDILKKLGMRSAFTFCGGFLGISSEDMCVSDVIQSTFIKVDEEGTEAAAFTVIAMILMCAPPQPFKVFTADHPFLYFLRDNDTGCILFMGRVMDPTKK